MIAFLGLLLPLLTRLMALAGVAWFAVKLERAGSLDTAATAAGQLTKGVGNTAEAVGSGAKGAGKTVEALSATPGGQLALAAIGGGFVILLSGLGRRR